MEAIDEERDEESKRRSPLSAMLLAIMLGSRYRYV